MAHTDMRKYVVHGVDQSGDEWIVGTVSQDTADSLAKMLCENGLKGVRVSDTENSTTKQFC